MSTPTAVNQYSRFMVDLFDDKSIIGVPSVWQTFFGRREHNSKTYFSNDSRHVEIDIMRGNERLAALIQRGTNSRNIGDVHKDTTLQNYTNIARAFPLAEEMGNIPADQLLDRVAGENPYEARSRIDRMRMHAREHHLEHIRRFARLFEVLCGSSILTGVQPAILGTTNTDLIYDFLRPATHIVTVVNAWDSAGADIMGDIDSACELVRGDAHVHPNVLFLGGEAMDALIKDSTTQTLADNRRYELIEVSTNNPVPPKLSPLVEAGAVARGRIRTSKGYELWIFTYIDTYDNSAGTATKYLPEDTGLVAYFGARCDRYFGPPEVLPQTASRAAWYQEMFGMNMMAPMMPANIKNMGAVIMPEMFHCDAYESSDHKKVTIRTQSAPIFSTTQTDAFVTLRGLSTSAAS